MSSGWMRFVFDQFEFPYEVVFARDIDEGNLSAKYDVLILPDDARLSGRPADTANTFQPRTQPAADRIPAEWRSRLGAISSATSLPRMKSFVENGGTLLAVGDASEIGFTVSTFPSGMQLPVKMTSRCRDRSIMCRARFCPLPWTARARLPGACDRAQTFSSTTIPLSVFHHDARAKGREARRVVRQPDAIAQRLGVGTEGARRRSGNRDGPDGEGDCGAVRTSGAFPGSDTWSLQIPVQRHLLRPGGPAVGVSHDQNEMVFLSAFSLQRQRARRQYNRRGRVGLKRCPPCRRSPHRRELINAMHDRYAGNWYRTLRFTQTNTFYTQSGGEQKSKWVAASFRSGSAAHRFRAAFLEERTAHTQQPRHHFRQRQANRFPQVDSGDPDAHCRCLCDSRCGDHTETRFAARST